MDLLTLALILVPAFLFWSYWKSRKTFSFWSSRGIPGPAPTFIIGNMAQIFKTNRGVGDLQRTQQYGRVHGLYHGSTPVLMVTDATLIKQILVKDFSHLVNRQKQPVIHELWAANVFAAEDEQWRRLRGITSPAFTSGKLRGMHGLMNVGVGKLTKYLDSVIEKDAGIIKSTKDVCAGFTIDVIASTSFATETNCNEESRGGTKSPFITYGQRFFWVNPLRALCFLFFPTWLLKLIRLKMVFDPEAFDWLINLAREMVRQRKVTGLKRNDFVQLLLDAKVDEKELEKTTYDKLTASEEKDDEPSTKNTSGLSLRVKTLSEEEIIAQCVIFFSAGFETTGTTLLHSIYLLSKNPAIQEKLFTILSRATEDLGPDDNSLAYIERLVNEMPYLDAVIKEVLRMYPPVTQLVRRVTSESYTLRGVSLPKDTEVHIGSYAVHYDPEYYPEPTRFNPDRFLPENKDKLVPYTYLPFGAGPRNCIGMRFAYQEIRLCLAKLILRYRFETTDGTPETLTFKKASPLLNTKTFPIKLSKRV